jgi:DNA-binding response OmpR family regulator
MLEPNTILYISDRSSGSNSVLAEFEEAGYKMVVADSPTEGVALLYIMRSVGAVVLDHGAREGANFDVVQSLRKIRPSVPVMLLRGDRIESVPSRTDECVGTDKLASALQRLLSAEPVAG